MRLVRPVMHTCSVGVKGASRSPDGLDVDAGVHFNRLDCPALSSDGAKGHVATREIYVSITRQAEGVVTCIEVTG